MAFRFSIGDRVSSTFGTTLEDCYGTVIRLERGAPVVVFDRWPNEPRQMRKAHCYPITRELVVTLANRHQDELNATQRSVLANNGMLL